MIQIEPVLLGLKKKDATQLNVAPMNIALFAESCGSYWQLFDEDGSKLDDGNMEIPSEIYLNWGEDDNIIVDYAIEQLGLTRKVLVNSTSNA